MLIATHADRALIAPAAAAAKRAIAQVRMIYGESSRSATELFFFIFAHRRRPPD